MNLERYLAEKNEIVNKALERLLVKADEYPKNLHKAMHYSLFAGGKRIRPILTIAAAESVGGSVEDVLTAACAIECIHTYSLIHDDLPALDNDDLRRGRPTCHKAFGEAAAILAGDALLTAAFEIMAKSPCANKDAVLMAIAEVARAAGSTGMIGGQVVDLESEGKEIPFPVLEYIHIHKTGALILASVRCGAMLGGAVDAQLSALTRYAGAIGLAFQIADDILDVEGSAQEMGKRAGGDELKGKATYPSFLGVEESRKRAGELTELAIGAISGFDARADALREIAKYITARRR